MYLAHKPGSATPATENKFGYSFSETALRKNPPGARSDRAAAFFTVVPPVPPTSRAVGRDGSRRLDRAYELLLTATGVNAPSRCFHVHINESDVFIAWSQEAQTEGSV